MSTAVSIFSVRGLERTPLFCKSMGGGSQKAKVHALTANFKDNDCTLPSELLAVTEGSGSVPSSSHQPHEALDT